MCVCEESWRGQKRRLTDSMRKLPLGLLTQETETTQVARVNEEPNVSPNTGMLPGEKLLSWVPPPGHLHAESGLLAWWHHVEASSCHLMFW